MKVKLPVAALIVLLCSSGCATSTKMYAPDGREAYSISCPGSANSWATCQKNASDICGSQGYSVLDSNGESHPFVIANQQTATAGVIVQRQFMIRCGT